MSTVGLIFKRDHKQAEAYLLDAEKRHPDSPEPKDMLVRLYIETKKYDMAIEVYKRWLVIAPMDVQVYLKYGALLQQLRRYEEALKVLWRANLVVPNQISVLMQISTIYLDMGEYEQAEELLKGIMILYPSYVPARFNLVRCYLKTGRVELAQTAIDELLDEYPNDFFAISLHGEIYLAQGDYQSFMVV